MDDKLKHYLHQLSFPQLVDDQNSNCNSIRSSTTTNLSKKRRRSSTINDRSDIFSTDPHLIYNQHILPSQPTNLKRSIDDDYLLSEYDQSMTKRIRYDQPNNIELENQPPRATIKRRSLFLYHPRQKWTQIPIEDRLSSPPTTTYSPISSPSIHQYEQNLSDYFPSYDIHSSNLSNQNQCLFENDPLLNPKPSINLVKDNLGYLSSQSNINHSPLRTTNFVYDSKQSTMSATIMRTGNVSPAHSDTSVESTSTCSSDEQQQNQQTFSLFNSHFHSYPHQHQSIRSYRERENYEQLLDLAEKLSDPNRFNKVDIEQFYSYRYKTSILTNDLLLSKQTACVICMSHFKTGQRIRVLPCQHEYHTKCIARWFTMNSSCPICRRDNFLAN